MKKLFFPAALFVLAAFVVVASFSGCGSSNTNNNTGSYLPGSCVGSGCNTNMTFNGGDTETFTATTAALSQYAEMAITNPTNMQVNIQLTEASTNPEVFLGQMIITFVDTATQIQHAGYFVNGTSLSGYRKYPNTVSTLITSSNTYRIFFEDPLGALVLTINAPTGTDTSVTSSGQIWFYNFDTVAPNPLFTGEYDPSGNYYPPGYVFCWMIDLGPYDCRNFNVPPSTDYNDSSGGHNTVPGFSLLGSIPTINLQNALGIQ